MTPLLKVEDLGVSYAARSGQRSAALAGLSFSLDGGEILGILGESGSGKSTLAAALLKVLQPRGAIHHGRIYFEGRDLVPLGSRDMANIRGKRIALIFQEPSLALHPAIRVRQQISDVIAAHTSMNRHQRAERVRQLLESVFSDDAERIGEEYPHELSGGQRTRVLIALAISCNPSLIIADEPTASLDSQTQQEIIALFQKLQKENGMAMIWITHNPNTLLGFADRVLVLYAGTAVETGPTQRVLCTSLHPYTRALLQSLPPGRDEGFARHRQLLFAIPGEGPTTASALTRCPFEPRCAERMALCATQAPQMIQFGERHDVACFRYQDESGK